jgi:serine/threonine-protein kinase
MVMDTGGLPDPMARTADANEPQDPLLGRNVGGKFVLEKQLGAGAMGAVYRARQTALEKIVAIKVMHGELARDPMFAARFHREAKAASRLDHPNSIRILDYGEDQDGLLYIAMEYLDGKDLGYLLEREWPLSTARAVDLLSQALSAIAVAHDLGITHRDIKPENIMVLRRTTDEGLGIDVVKVCDFGIAKVAEADDPASVAPGRGKLTTAGLVIGTPAYMSPEQGRGEVIDGRSDLYSMGIILYQVLTGELPFDAPSAIGLVVMHQTVAPPAPSSRRADVDRGLEAVCLKALEKDRGARFQTARDFRAALRSAAEASAGPMSQSGSGSHSGAFSPGASAPGSRVVLPAATQPIGSEAVNARTELQLAAVPAPAVLATGAGVLATGAGSVMATGAILPGAEPPKRKRWPAVLAGLVVLSAVGVVGFRMQGTKGTSVPVTSVPAATLATAELVPPAPGEHGRSAQPAETAAPAEVERNTGKAAAERGQPEHEATRHPSGRGTATLSDQSPVRLPVNAAANVAPVPAPPAPSPPPAETVAAPVVPPPPPPLAPVVPDPPAPPAFNVATATVAIGSPTNLVQTGANKVTSMMSHVASTLVGCYQRALPGLSGSIDGAGTLHIDTDDSGIVTTATLKGPVRGAVASCIEAAVRGQKVDGVDTGSASADVPLVFKPR